MAVTERVEDSIRTFVALRLSEALADKISHLQLQLRQQFPVEISFTRREQFHLTLIFLGAVAVSKLEALEEQLQQVASQSCPFLVEFNTVGCFPIVGPPRVLWLGTKLPGEPLLRLVSTLRSQLQSFASQKVESEFAAHITLGRVRKGASPRGIRNMMSVINVTSHNEMFDSIVLVESQQATLGSHYIEKVKAVFPVKELPERRLNS